MAASRKKGGAKSTPPPIEGEILSGHSTEEDELLSAGDSSKSSGVDIFRRFVWYLTAAGIVFIAGLVAAPTIQDGIDSLLGREKPPPVTAEDREVLTDAGAAADAADAPITDILPPVRTEPQRGDLAPETAEDVAEETVVTAAQPDPGLVDLAARVTALETVPADGGEIAGRLEKIEERLAVLEAAEGPGAGEAGAGPGIGPRIAELEARLSEVEALEHTASQGAANTNGVLLALARLSQRIDDGQVFSGELLEFRTLFDALPVAARTGNETHVALLEQLASSGVGTPAMLRRAFAGLMPAALEAAALPQDASWWDKVWVGLKGVVVVRRTGQVEGEDAEAVLARVEFHLAEGDIAAALDESQNLEPRVQDVLRPWQAEAATSLAVGQAVDALVETYSGRQDTAPPAQGG